MLISFVVLGILANGGSGVGLKKVYSMSMNEGFSYSKYRIGSTLKDLCSIGAIVKVGTGYCLTLLGANLVAADICAANGYEVIAEDNFRMSMPAYHKEGK